MMRVDEAIEIILNTINPIAEIQFVDLFNGGGRILAEDVYSPFDVPPLNNSAMDGYAIISSDTK
ncbi:MAG: molybdopterin molybdenumtransferase MoeA, partial [Spirochaetes bacterium]|nr:molybdopterin molybdenumtransferase MoeA [Spirochaetota bacterium]